MTSLTAAVVPLVQVPVGVGKQPAKDGTKPFIVIWPNAGVRSAVTMKANDGTAETWTCHHFGLTPESAEVAVNQLTDAVYALYRTTVDGRVVQWPEQLSSPPMQRDDTGTDSLFDLIVEWVLRTTPA